MVVEVEDVKIEISDEKLDGISKDVVEGWLKAELYGIMGSLTAGEEFVKMHWAGMCGVVAQLLVGIRAVEEMTNIQSN